MPSDDTLSPVLDNQARKGRGRSAGGQTGSLIFMRLHRSFVMKKNTQSLGVVSLMYLMGCNFKRRFAFDFFMRERHYAGVV